VIVGAAFCPHPPALVPQLAQGAAAELALVRAAAIEAVRTVAVGPGLPVFVLGPGPHDTAFPPGATGSMAGFGVDLTVTLGAAATRGEIAGPLPLSLTVGAWLLREAGGAQPRARGWSFAATDGSAPTPPALLAELREQAVGDCVLLVMGDGSARRSTTAPGSLDPRAAAFDAGVAAALAGGDPKALADIDPVLGTQLLAAGVPAWHAAAAVLSSPGSPPCYDASVLLEDAPYGVGYFVSTWLAPGRPGE
jgi:hypothetical protein